DLPEPAAPKAIQRPYPPGPPWVVRRRGPRLLPVLLLVLLAALLPGGHWLFFGVLQVVMVFWLVACLGGIFAMSRAHRHHRHWLWGPTGSRPGRCHRSVGGAPCRPQPPPPDHPVIASRPGPAPHQPPRKQLRTWA